VHDFLAIDFEIATRDPLSACAVGLVRCAEGRVVERELHLIRPPTRTFHFTQIHGLAWEDVCDAPDFVDVWAAIAERFDGLDFVAAHNAAFDRAVLTSCCHGFSLAGPTVDWVCTVRLARRMWRLKPADLASCARFLCVPLDHHEALSDAHACAQIVLAAEIDGWRHDGAGG